jgi:hypothetical protein
MENLQSYLFENSEDFSEKHYINLMALLLKAHNERQVRTVYVEGRVITDYGQERINSIRERHNIQETVTISEEIWHDVLKPILSNYDLDTSIDSENIFFDKLKGISNVSTQFIFPDCLTSQQRQKIHIMSKYSDVWSITFTKRNGIRNNINIFLA